MNRSVLERARIDVISNRSANQTLTTTVQDIIDVCNVSNVRNNKTVTLQTQAERQRTIHKIFRDLVNRTGFKLIDPFNLTREHIEALVNVWVQEGLSAKTIVTYLSALRIFCRWVGKGGLVRSPEEYVADAGRVKVARVSARDKSQSINAVIFDENLRNVMEFDEHVGHQLIAVRAFGFKVQEAICLKPNQIDQDGVLHLMQGHKERRILVIPLDTDDRRRALAMLKEFASRNKARGGIADKSKDVNSQKKRFHYVLNKCGVTLRDTTAAPSECCPETS